MAKRDLNTICIGGLPASGKTTLIRELRKKLGTGKSFKFGKLYGVCYNNNVFLLGIYDKKLFSGTDRLSMAVQPDAEKFLEYMSDKEKTIIFEGDRLFNVKFLDQCINRSKCKIYILSAKKEIIETRHIDRKDTQTDKFKKSRHTKITNIFKYFFQYKENLRLLDNNNKKELKNNVDLLWQDLKNMI